MELFTDKNLVLDGDWVVYKDPEGNKRNIAEFRVDKAQARSFMRFMIANITAKRCLRLLDDGVKPMVIARDRGFRF
jgi:hypothetical protein